MKRYTVLFLVFLMFSFAGAQNQNLTVSSFVGTHVDTILQRHLAGDGVLISGCPYEGVFSSEQVGKFNNQTGNVTYQQIGSFNRNGYTSFPFETGIVMTTGKVGVAAGPNDQTSKSDAVTNYYTETALSSLASGNINGSASLEFDFIAMADTFAFNYIFASEEYPEFACSSFNDVFAFFLTGIDPVTYVTTTKNVAIVPNTITASNPNGIPVAINSINSGPGTSGSSSNCIPPGSSAPYSQYYVNNPAGSPGIQYDGRTTALSAQSVIFSCQTYHMKLCLANVGDNAYDSGVFIEEGSFYSPHVKVEQNWATAEGGDTLVQNCRDLDLTFKIERPALTASTSIIIETSGNAVLGYDYALLKPDGTQISIEDNSFFFPAGDTIQQVHVEMLPTVQFPDPNQVKEAKLYVVTQGCTGYGNLMDLFQKFDTITLHFRANDTIRLRDTAITRCEVLDHIEVEQVGGTAPSFYQWINAPEITNPDQLSSDCNITQNGTYYVVATDKWGCMRDTAKVQVSILPKPDFTITYTPDHGCMPLPVTLQTQYSPDYAKIYWTISNDSTFNYIDSVSTIHTSLPEPGYYDISLLVESAPGCSDSIKYNNVIHVADFPHADFTFSPAEPENGEEVFFYNFSTGENITNYSWNFGDGHSSHLQEPSHAYHLTESDLMTVQLTVTNSDGCSDDTIQVVPVEDNFAFFVPSAFTPNTDGKNEVFLPRVNDVVDYEFTIYARTGELIFYTNNPEIGWDGTVQGKPAPQGVYLWKIHYAKIGTPDEKMMKTGSVTLIR